MTEIDWISLKTLKEISNTDISDPWLVAVEMVYNVTHLRIRAEGTWSPMPGVLTGCEPNGHVGLLLPADRLVISNCAVGALIGRLGGSSAGCQTIGSDPEKNQPFPIGKYCILALREMVVGPLFIGFNTLVRPVHITHLKITVDGATPTA